MATRKERYEAEPALLHEDLIALIQGSLDSGEAVEVRALIETDPAYGGEYAYLAALAEDLDVMRRKAERGVPAIDLVDSVMATVHGADAAEPKVVPFDQKRRRAKLFWVAAAAALAAVIGLVAYQSVRPGPGEAGPRIARPAIPEQHGDPGSEPVEEQSFEVAKSTLATQLDRLAEQTGKTAGTDELEEVSGPPLADVSMQDILDARREAGEGGWQQLRKWASLTPEEAAEIIASEDVAMPAVVGAAVSLEPADAQQALLTAIGELPEDPYVRFAFVQVGAQAPETAQPETLGEVQALHELDPDNALSYYLEAKLLLDEGNLEGALEALAQARELEGASAYSLQAAKYQEQALIERGLEPDAARMLAAMTAGMDEYDFLCDLGDDLLEYGQAALDAGQPESAQEIFESVQRMGVQLESGAAMLQEQLAALDVQQMANVALEGLYVALESVEGIEALTVQTWDLVAGLQHVEDFIAALDQLFLGKGESGFWNTVADIILLRGDLNLFGSLDSGTAPEVPVEAAPAE